MKVFVTGGTGFIGQHVLRQLRRRGHDVFFLTRAAASSQKALPPLKGSLEHIGAWEKKLKAFHPDAVIHLAWEGIPDFSAPMCAKNLAQGAELFRIVSEAGCRKIVAAGTCFEYGNVTGKINEADPVALEKAFIVAKHSLQLMGEAIAREKGMDFIWLRPFYVYGPGQRPGSLIPSIIRAAREGVPADLKMPLARNDFVYVSDVAAAFVAAVELGQGIQTYNVGSGKLSSVKDITKIVYDALGRKNVYDLFVDEFKGALSDGFYADIARTRRALKWQPTIDIRKGIMEMLAHPIKK